MDTKAVTGDQLVEKLDTLGLKTGRPGSEGSYDYLEKPDSMERPVEPTLSISTTEEWEKHVMQDPKVSSLTQSQRDDKLTARIEPSRSNYIIPTRQYSAHAESHANQRYSELQRAHCS